MSEISIYDIVPTPKLADKLIGTSVGGVIPDVTYNFTLQELLQLFIPVLPANNLQGVLDYGNTATQNINLTGTISTTNLTVLATANILNSNLSGNTRVMAGLFDRINVSGTSGQVLRSTGTQVEWYTVPTVIPTLQQVLQSGNASDISIVLTANITAVSSTAANVVSNTSLNVNGLLKDGIAAVGTSNQILSSTGSGVRWVDMPVYNAISPLLYNTTTKTFSIQGANGSQNGYLSSVDWINFDGKQGAIVLTTIGSSGVATFVGNTLNIPTYSPDLSGYVPTSRTLTINGVTYDLSANRSWTLPVGVASVTATAPLFSSGGAGPNISITQSNATTNGYLSAVDWLAFNDKQNTLNGTGLVKSTAGVISYITDNSSNWNTAYNDSIVSAAVTGTATKTLTLTQQDAGIITASWSDIDTGLTSVGVSMPAAFNVANSPLTVNGIIAITGAGTSLQYIDGTGTLQTFPGLTGYVPYTGATTNVNLGIHNLTAAALIKNGGTSSQFLKADGSVDSSAYIILGSLSATAPLLYNNTTGAFSISQSGAAADGYLSSIDWNTFNNKQAAITAGTTFQYYRGDKTFQTLNTTVVLEGSNLYYLDSRARAAVSLTTSGSSGVSTYNSTTGVFNIPNYGSALSSYLPLTGGTLTGGLVINPANSAVIGLDAASDTFRLRSDSTQPFARQLITTMGSGTLVKMQAAGYGATYVTDLGLYTSSNAAVNTTPNIYLTGGDNRVGINTITPAYTLDVIGTAGVSGVFTLGSTISNGTFIYTLPGATGTLALVGGSGVGTVTSVAALTLGTIGTDLSSSVANSTTTPVITLNVPTASAINRGVLSAADWATFNAKQVAGNYIVSLTGEATGTGPGATAVTLNNASVTGKILTGVNITGGTVLATDTMLTAFGKLQNQINGLVGSTIYQGVWNASTNTPTLTSSVGTNGYYYIVNVLGSTNLNGITDWKVGDWAIFNGGVWQKVDNTDAVTSVNGFTGAVSLTTDNVAQGTTNLYFSNALARAAISLTVTGASGASTYNNTTGVLNVPTYTLSGLGGQPLATNLTSLSGLSYVSTSFVKMTAAGTFALDTTAYGTGSVTSVGLSSATSGVTIGTTPITTSGTITLAIATASGSQQGLLSAADWTTFNNKAPSVAGGYLPLSGGTLTGALSGTSATFSGAISLGNNNTFPTGAGIFQGSNFLQLVSGSGGLTINNNANTVTNFSITNAGAATFSGALSGTSATFSGQLNVNYANTWFRNEDNLVYRGIVFGATIASGVEYASIKYQPNSGQLLISASPSGFGGNTLFKNNDIAWLSVNSSNALSFTGAATFSSSVTASGSHGAGSFNAFIIKNTLSSGASGKISWQGNANNETWAIAQNQTVGAGYLEFNYLGLNKLVIDPAGNVGIGTASPSYPLSVFKDTNGEAVLQVYNPNAGSGAYSAIYLGNNLSTNSGGLAMFSSAFTASGMVQPNSLYVSCNKSGGISINAEEASAVIRLGTANTERVRITPAGNVLIGTTTDATGKLQVNGSVYATSFFESSSVAYKNILATNPITALNVDVIKYKRTNVDVDDVRYGYSAEQINSLMPELTNKDATAVKYLDVHTLLIAELQREIKELKAKLN